MSRSFWDYDEDFLARANVISKWMHGWCRYITLWVILLCLSYILSSYLKG